MKKLLGSVIILSFLTGCMGTMPTSGNEVVDAKTGRASGIVDAKTDKLIDKKVGGFLDKFIDKI